MINDYCLIYVHHNMIMHCNYSVLKKGYFLDLKPKYQDQKILQECRYSSATITYVNLTIHCPIFPDSDGEGNFTSSFFRSYAVFCMALENDRINPCST